jgi:uncharacterized membrane protein
MCLAALVAPIVALPIVVPLLESAGFHRIAGVLYFVFGLTCHQLPERSFHVRGEQVAVCQRDIAITATVLFSLLLAFAVPRLRSIPPASLRTALLISIPLAVDGLTQLVGLRESSWELRVATGVVFAAGWSWFAIPRLNTGFESVIHVTHKRSMLSQST